MPSRYSLPVFIPLLFLASINLLMINSLAPNLLLKQAISWVIGIILFLIGLQINPKYSTQIKWPLFALSCFLLLAPIIQNEITRGSSRWLYFLGISIQPSEIVKPLLMIFLANTSFPFLHLIPVGIILLQPDLGSAMSVLALMIPVVIFNKKTMKITSILILIGLLLSPLIWNFGLHDYQRQRIYTFLNPNSDPLGKGYNVIQSQIAIGSGGFWGRGYKKGTQGQLLFLPEKHTDFVFAATAEELGFVSIFIILGAYYVLIRNLIKKAFESDNRPQLLFTLGIAIQIWFQLFINIGMNLGLLPVTGIPLPFISVGGSSIMALLFSFGIIFAI